MGTESDERKMKAVDDGDGSGVDTSVIDKTSHGGGFGGFGGLGGFGGDGGSSGGAATEGGGGGGFAVVDAGGQVVGSAHVAPDGAVEIDGTETTVVDESSGVKVRTVGIAFGGLDADLLASLLEPDEGPTPAAPSALIDPQMFVFRRVVENWQETRCVAIHFRQNAGGPVFKLGVKVGVPIRLADGTLVTPERAQLEAATDATAVALRMAAALESGAVNPSEVMALFWQEMARLMLVHQIGYRVQQCRPQ